MRIALCSYSQKEKETALLMKQGRVDRFDNGVFCTYAMQRDGPYDAVVVMEDGARGMNFCMSIRGYSKDVPLLWISDQAEFEPPKPPDAGGHLFGKACDGISAAGGSIPAASENNEKERTV